MPVIKPLMKLNEMRAKNPAAHEQVSSLLRKLVFIDTSRPNHPVHVLGGEGLLEAIEYMFDNGEVVLAQNRITGGWKLFIFNYDCDAYVPFLWGEVL